MPRSLTPPGQATPLEPRLSGGAAGQGSGSPPFWTMSPGESDPLAAESDLGQEAVGVNSPSALFVAEQTQPLLRVSWAWGN